MTKQEMKIKRELRKVENICSFLHVKNSDTDHFEIRLAHEGKVLDKGFCVIKTEGGAHIQELFISDYNEIIRIIGFSKEEQVIKAKNRYLTSASDYKIFRDLIGALCEYYIR